MIFDDRHLHIDEQDPRADWLARSISAAKTGTIKLDIDGQPAVKIDLINCSTYTDRRHFQIPT